MTFKTTAPFRGDLTILAVVNSVLAALMLAAAYYAVRQSIATQFEADMGALSIPRMMYGRMCIGLVTACLVAGLTASVLALAGTRMIIKDIVVCALFSPLEQWIEDGKLLFGHEMLWTYMVVVGLISAVVLRFFRPRLTPQP